MNENHDPLAWARYMELDSPAPYDITQALVNEYKGQAEQISAEIDRMKKAGRPHEEIEDLVFRGENIRALLSDIFYRRLRKIMALARDWPRIDMKDQCLLPWERVFFERVVTLVEEYRAEGWIE